MYKSRWLSTLILLLGTICAFRPIVPWFDVREESGNAYVYKRNRNHAQNLYLSIQSVKKKII